MPEKSKKGRPKIDTEAVNLRLPREMIEFIDDLRRHEPDMPTRPEMIRRVLSNWFRQTEK